MLLKNETKSIQQFSLGSELGGETRFLQIPSRATVELDDKDWETLISSRTRVQVYEVVSEAIGTEEFGQAKIGKELLYKTVNVPTGTYRYINLVMEQVREGRLTIVKAPDLGLTITQLIRRINLVKGLSVNEEEFTLEELEGIYLENRTKIDAAVKLATAAKADK